VAIAFKVMKASGSKGNGIQFRPKKDPPEYKVFAPTGFHHLIGKGNVFSWDLKRAILSMSEVGVK
jgi:hypothetical protein